MSILITGMEMPPDCFHCHLSFMRGERLFCSAMKNEEVLRAKIDPNCPLVSVPPHGRLIDADALMLHIQGYIEEYDDDLDDNGYHSGKWCAMKEAEMVINDAPTIIPAEEGE